jgi:hypothetical protein
VQPTARELFTFQRIRQQLGELERIVKQRVDGNDGRYRRRRRTAHARLQGHSLAHRERRAARSARSMPQRLRRDGGGILFRVGRQVRVNLAVQPAHLFDRDARCPAAGGRHPVTGATAEREAEHIEADADVSNGRGRECRRLVRHSPRRC